MQEKLQDSPNKAAATAWPMFFYPPNEYDPTDMFQGLLRGELLVYVRPLLLRLPSADLRFRLSNMFTPDHLVGTSQMVMPATPAWAMSSWQTWNT